MTAATTYFEDKAKGLYFVGTSIVAIAGVTPDMSTIVPNPAAPGNITTTPAGAAVILVDLDNGQRLQGDGYLHNPRGTGVKFNAARNLVVQTNATGGATAQTFDATQRAWGVTLGVITAINQTRALIEHFCRGAAGHSSGASNPLVYEEHYDGYMLDMSVADGKGVKSRVGTALNQKHFTSINTATAMLDAFGNSVIPAVGDVILYVIDEFAHLGIGADITTGMACLVNAGYEYAVD